MAKYMRFVADTHDKDGNHILVVEYLDITEPDDDKYNASDNTFIIYLEMGE